MGLDPDRVETVTFDSYGTLVDVEAVERALAERVSDPASVSRLWRYRSLTYAMASTLLERHRSFYDLLGQSLSHALAAHGEQLPDDELEAILETYHDLDPFEDVKAALDRLYDRGYDLQVVSNGTQEMLDSMLEGVGIGGLVDRTVSADEVESFKPAPAIYRHAAARAGTPVDRIVHVSALWLDVQGAVNAGMDGAWVTRGGAVAEPFGVDPDLQIGDLHELADALDA